jgi:uncharacterized membrane protein YhiD involved in acid resistance
MAFVQKLYDRLDGLERKIFYRYLMIVLLGITTLTTLIIVYFYITVHSLHRQLNDINDLRVSQVKSILSKIEHVKKQRAEVNAILDQDKSFKIGGYFNEIISVLNIAENKKEETTSQGRLDEEYRESVLTAKFNELTMKQLCELLNIIEQNKRVYTKALEIQKSMKTPKTIDVTLTIATLQPRSAAIE